MYLLPFMLSMSCVLWLKTLENDTTPGHNTLAIELPGSRNCSGSLWSCLNLLVLSGADNFTTASLLFTLF